MAIKYLSSIDLRTNELQYAVIQPLGTAPTGLTPKLGQVYFNTADDKLKIYSSTGWVTVGGVNSVTSGDTNKIDVDNTDPANPVIYANVAPVTNDSPNLVTGDDVYEFVTGFGFVESVNSTNSTFVTTAISGTATDPVVTSSLSATGTPDATKYLRGDNTWSPVSGIYSFFVSDLVTSTEVPNAGIVEITGTANEVEVSLTNKKFTVGLPNDVTIANDLTVNGSIVVDGDMTINGTVTTINTETINLADNVILLNSNLVGAPTTNAGIEINRGTSDNRSLIWDEAQGEWVIEVSTGQYYPIAYVDGPTSYATTIGGSTSSVINHGLNSFDVSIQLYDLVSYETVYADVMRVDTNNIYVAFNTAPGAGTIRVLVNKIG